MKVFTVVGNRPQFIKAAALSAALRAAGIDEVVLHTGQHWHHTLSQVFFDQLGVPEPRYRLDLHTSEIERMRPAVADRIRAEEPDIVLVYGDTNSTVAGVRAAGDTSIPVAHVEAGLRSGDLEMPEEHNRIETDRLAWLLFCPDDRSRLILREEGVLGRIYVVGDVMADATRVFAPVARSAFPVPHEPRSYVVVTIHRQANVALPRLAAIVDGVNAIDDRSRLILREEGVLGRIYVVGDVMADATRVFAPVARSAFPVPHEPRSYVVVTIHRQANVALPRLAAIVGGVNAIDDLVVFPVHPRTRARIEEAGLVLERHVRLIEPLSYLEFTSLVSQARVIVTDSGGLQKEAYWHGVPCVTIRPSTEWVDTVAVGANVLVDADASAIAEAVAGAVLPPNLPVLYGDGHASERIAQVLAATIPSR